MHRRFQSKIVLGRLLSWMYNVLFPVALDIYKLFKERSTGGGMTSRQALLCRLSALDVWKIYEVKRVADLRESCVQEPFTGKPSSSIWKLRIRSESMEVQSICCTWPCQTNRNQHTRVDTVLPCQTVDEYRQQDQIEAMLAHWLSAISLQWYDWRLRLLTCKLRSYCELCQPIR